MRRVAQAHNAALVSILGLLAAAIPRVANCHSASDAYLTLTAVASAPAGQYVIHGQWDIALRDLDFVLKLDDNGDGRLSWGEVSKHRAAIESYAFRYLKLSGGANNRCAIKPQRQMIDDHADGSYAALFFDAVCARPPKKLSLSYTLFFTIDPSHRGIFVMNKGGDLATALFSPDKAKIELAP
jgi:hypothetical protein